MPETARSVIDKINKTGNPVKRMRLALKFFSRSSTYSRDAIGWGEDYASIDDGMKVARAALRKTSRTEKRK